MRRSSQGRARKPAARRAAAAFDVAWAWWALALARLQVWLRPTGRLLGSDEPPAAPAAAPLARERAVRLARAVDRAARGPLRATCLVRAVALHRLLQASGVDGSLVRIGVRAEGGRFAAHAWVEYHGAALGTDGARARSFLPLAPEALGPGAEFGR
ncbi:MAG TPA: lasso peptide biosynthesis B2 protein [Longimicrobium sp.]|jgi:hypothetical protein